MKFPRAMYSLRMSFWVVPRSVFDRVDRDARAADLAETARVVGVQSELGREIEGHRQPRRPLRQQVPVALVGLLGARVPRVLAHRPQLPPIHVRMDAAGERVLARPPQSDLQIVRNIIGGVEGLDLDAGVREPARVVGADDRSDRAVLVGGRHLPPRG
jgi:hypothetical protein